ncbi:MAG: CYTH domain-containing protein [Deltaproteobacteria bacterium]|nr:CYTH domain-containing protein [Deltaproteobacteria bacterium]MBW2303934.1 CYTH domain-containing protein [Deltaproteobacteria bacterium]
MAVEIERKFLVKGEGWRGKVKGVFYRQGYLSTEKERVVRVRATKDKGFLTIKGAPENLKRPEYEYEIPVKDAEEMLDSLCIRPLIEKTRYRVEHGGFVWEIDVFSGENKGLVLAEVEIQDQNQEIPLPEWIGEEVSGDPRYTNAQLVKNPYIRWNP